MSEAETATTEVAAPDLKVVKAPAKGKVVAPEVIATISVDSGHFVIGDAAELDSKWATGKSQGKWYVDVRGPNAQKLTGRTGGGGKLKRAELAPDYFRIICPDALSAGQIYQAIHQFIGRDDLPDTVHKRGAASATTKVHDVLLSGNGAGKVFDLGAVEFSGELVEIAVERDASGKVTRAILTAK